MKVTAIIPSLYEVDGKYLKLAVESLRATTDWDIIVVTNGMQYKPDLSHIKGITTHLHYYEQGQGIAVNAGAQVAPSNTGYFFISNSDMYYAPGWNNKLRFDDLVFCPNLIEPVNNAGSAPPFLKADAGLTLEEFKPEVVDETIDAEWRKLEHEKRSETGFNFPLFVQKDVWQTIGGYDKAYDPWGSNGDTDLQAMIHIAGIQPVRLRDVLVYHFSNKSGTFDGSHQAEWQRNFDYFTKKFGFNRDTVPGCDVWYSKNVLPEDESQIVFKPTWRNKYAEAEV